MKTARIRITRIAQLLFVLIVLCVGLSTASWACSCLHRTNCGMKRYGDSVFVGEVLSRHVEIPRDRVLYQVRVTETFRGDQRVGDVVTVRTGFGGGDCGYRFKIGSKYLIDASNRNQSLTTGICFLTAPVDESEVELRTLRAIAAGQHPPDLTGVLMHGTETEDGETLTPLSLTPLSDVSVQAKRIGGLASANASTDAFGSFTFQSLREGTYQLVLGIPANLSPAYADGGTIGENEIPTISIVNKDGGPLACHVLVVVEQSGSISGVVQFPGGAPIEGWVDADTVSSDDRPWNTVRTAVPGTDGKFVLPHLKPGRYSVQFTSRKGFVRGTRQIVDLKDGERRTGVTLASQ